MLSIVLVEDKSSGIVPPYGAHPQTGLARTPYNVKPNIKLYKFNDQLSKARLSRATAEAFIYTGM